MERSTDARTQQCTDLFKVLGDKVSYVSEGNYNSSMGSYWSSQEANLVPKCIVSPRSVDDVAAAIKTLYDQQLAGQDVSFAIRGGGHTPWAGSANIQDGVTIDMRAINGIEVSDDLSVTYVGAGAIWGDVYKKMDSLGLVVVGGRLATIGVGGLLTGGGISIFSARKGFACDNVVNYEVVLANGTVVSANETQNPDLFLALKGGSNNFGVVTRFDLKTFHGSNFWGGFILWPDSASLALIEAFSNLDLGNGYDKYAALILSFSSVVGVGEFASANMAYTKPTPNPPTFLPFTSVQPQLQNTMRITSQTDFVTELVALQTSGRRQTYITNTFKNDFTLIKDIYALSKITFKQLPQTPGITLSFNIQPIPPATTSETASSPSGGNMLGLSPSDGALVLCLIAVTWDNPAEDTQVQTAARVLNDEAVQLAKSRGLFNKWIYLNYAAQWQDPIGGYGEVNKAKLQATSKKYDPQGIFQKNVPGGFKLFP